MSLAISNIESSVTVVYNNKILPFQLVEITGGVEPFRFTIEPRLPAGMSMSIGSGELLGTPGIEAPTTLYEVTVEDAEANIAKTNVEIIVYVPQANVVTSNIMTSLDMTSLETLTLELVDLEGGDDNFQVYGQANIATLGFTRFNSNVKFDDKLTADHAYYIHRYL